MESIFTNWRNIMKKQKNYSDKLVGRIGDTYYICECIFNNEDFKGVVGAALTPISRARYEEATNPTSPIVLDYFKELWITAVENGTTEQSLRDFAEEQLIIHGAEAIFDFGDCKHWEIIRKAEPTLTEEDYPAFEFVAAGRCFSPRMKWDKLYDEKLWNKIVKIESK